MKKVSILGCGWLGTAVADGLIAKGYLVNGSTTSESKIGLLERQGIKPYVITLDPRPSGEDVKNFFSSEILIVSIPPGRKSGSTAMYLEKMEALSMYLPATEVKYVLFVSSTSVYADAPKEMYENDADINSYLVRAERYFLEDPSLKTTVLRFGGLIGPDRHPGKFLAGKTGLSGAHHPVNVIHQQDCVNVMFRILEQGCWGEILNACCDVHMHRKEFYTAAAIALRLSPPEFLEDQFSLSSNDNSSHISDQLFGKTVNSGKLKRLLNFQFENQLVLDLLRAPVN